VFEKMCKEVYIVTPSVMVTAGERGLHKRLAMPDIYLRKRTAHPRAVHCCIGVTFMHHRQQVRNAVAAKYGFGGDQHEQQMSLQWKSEAHVHRM
jgi:hypothetical protein